MRGAAGWCALTALGYLAVRWLLQALLSSFMSLRVPGASLADPIGYTQTAVGLLSLLAGAGAIAIPLLFLLRSTRLQARDLRILWPSQWAPLFCAGLFLGLANLGNLFGGLLNRLLGNTSSATELPAGGPALLVYFLLLCVLPALGEELLFRGALQGLMRPCGSAAAIVAPALLFALLHLDPAQSLTALLCGLFLGWLTERTGSILPGMLLHFINNTLAFFSLYLQLYAPTQIATAVQLLLLLGCPVLGGFLLWQAVQQDFRFDTGLRPGPHVSAIFTSPAYLLGIGFLAAYMVYLRLGGTA